MLCNSPRVEVLLWQPLISCTLAWNERPCWAQWTTSRQPSVVAALNGFPTDVAPSAKTRTSGNGVHMVRGIEHVVLREKDDRNGGTRSDTNSPATNAKQKRILSCGNDKGEVRRERWSSAQDGGESTGTHFRSFTDSATRCALKGTDQLANPTIIREPTLYRHAKLATKMVADAPACVPL